MGYFVRKTHWARVDTARTCGVPGIHLQHLDVHFGDSAGRSCVYCSETFRVVAATFTGGQQSLEVVGGVLRRLDVFLAD